MPLTATWSPNRLVSPTSETAAGRGHAGGLTLAPFRHGSPEPALVFPKFGARDGFCNPIRKRVGRDASP